jgi:hypothetical protein
MDTSKLEKLAQSIHSTQQFITPRTNRYTALSEIVKQLDEVGTAAKTRKLSIKIFSRSPVSSQAIYSFLSSSALINQLYQLEISKLPINSAPEPVRRSPALTLQPNSVTGQQLSRYELTTAQSILIGRDQQSLSEYPKSQNTQLIALVNYKKVSSVHARVSSLVSTDLSTHTWQICDLESRNGTYVNGQRISDSRVLRNGDRITLAYPSASEKAPEFIFECQPDLISDNSSSESALDCDLVFLAVDPKQELTNVEKQLIEQVSKAPIVSLVIIADLSGASTHEATSIRAGLSIIDNWIKVQHSSLIEKLDLSCLVLQPFYPNSANTSIGSNWQREYESLLKPLMILGKEHADAILASRLRLKLLSQFTRVEKVIAAQEAAFNTEIKQLEEMLSGQTLDEWREYIQKAFRRASDDREDLFRRVRNELSRSKNDQTRDFIPNSLMQRIDQFVNTFEPVVTRLNRQVCIQLQPKYADDTHVAMIQFCQKEISQWAEEEWKKACNFYGDGGLNGLLQRSYNTLNCLPSLSLSNPFNKPSSQIDVWSSMPGSFVEVQDYTSYYEGSDTFVNAVKFATQAAIAAGMYFVNPVSAAVQAASLAASVMSVASSSLNRSQIQNLKLEQVIVGLRKTASIYYRIIAGYLLDRAIQEIGMSVDNEERQFRKALESADEQFKSHFNNLRVSIDGYRNRQLALDQDKSALEQIKQTIS